MLVPQQSGGKIADKHLFVQSSLLSQFAVNFVCKHHINKVRNLGGRQEVESLLHRKRARHERVQPPTL